MRLYRKNLLIVLGDVFLIFFAYLYVLLYSFGLAGLHILHVIVVGGTTVATCLSAFYIADLYSVDIQYRKLKYICRFMLAMIAVVLFMGIMLTIVGIVDTKLTLSLQTVAWTGIFTYCWRIIFQRTFRCPNWGQKRILIVGAGHAGKKFYRSIMDNPCYKVIGFIDDDQRKWGIACSPKVLGGRDILRETIRAFNVDKVIVTVNHIKVDELSKSIHVLKTDKVQVCDVSSFHEESSIKIPLKHINSFCPIYDPRYGIIRGVYFMNGKRVIDLMLSFFGLTINVPVMILTAIAIRLESGGPIFYRQKRVGLNGKIFELIKFRSMIGESNRDGVTFAEKLTPRITRVGRIIRALRIDEIPQMWNVLKGDMSFIGPRALIEEEEKEFNLMIPYFSLRHMVKPGITGWAQVNYNAGTRVEDAAEKLRYDLFYIKNLSPLLDFHILLKTVKVILWRRGAIHRLVCGYRSPGDASEILGRP